LIESDVVDLPSFVGVVSKERRRHQEPRIGDLGPELEAPWQRPILLMVGEILLHHRRTEFQVRKMVAQPSGRRASQLGPLLRESASGAGLEPPQPDRKRGGGGRDEHKEDSASRHLHDRTSLSAARSESALIVSVGLAGEIVGKTPPPSTTRFRTR